MGEFNPPVRECITLREAEEYAGCDREKIRRMIVHGEVPAVRIGQMWVTTRDALDKAFEKRVEGWLNVHRRMERGAKIRADWRCPTMWSAPRTRTASSVNLLQGPR
jgi:excisionase family DNA binding protein